MDNLVQLLLRWDIKEEEILNETYSIMKRDGVLERAIRHYYRIQQPLPRLSVYFILSIRNLTWNTNFYYFLNQNSITTTW